MGVSETNPPTSANSAVNPAVSATSVFRPFHKVLIANRGEIAVRIARACADSGLASVAVYSEEDRDAMHVRVADEAFSLNGTTAAETYLNIEKIVDTARRAGADAVHPGYGFLAESADFAAAVTAAGLVWIGPSAEAIEALGDKVSARHIAASVGAPLLPGTAEPVASAQEVADFAHQAGFPVIIKAAYGGGGRGMRVVASEGEIEQAFATAQREAIAAFGRGECFVERYLTHPRHVETQCVADRFGTVAVVSTRDCSLQRRHQKLVEEAPAPFLPDQVRERIERASRDILRAAGYVGAATVEFLVDDVARNGSASPRPFAPAAPFQGVDDDGSTGGTPSSARAGAPGGDADRFSVAFMEVNTRLQVEHPVTEEVSNVDLVREQFRVAAGEPLGYDHVHCHGHAIEFRINGEDPANNFMPGPGTVSELRLPGGPGVRCDFGYEAGDELSGSFDSMLGKVIVRGRDREQCLARARRALRETKVVGLPTVLAFHRAVLEEPDFAAPGGADEFRVHTRWIETDGAPMLERLAAAGGEPAVQPAPAPMSPLLHATERVVVEVAGRRMEVVLPAGLARLASASAANMGAARPGRRTVRRAAGAVAAAGAPGPVGAAGAARAAGPGAVTAPMQGTVVRVAVAEGQTVQAGDLLVVVEAMKMEQPLTAPCAGTVTGLAATAGAHVAAGQLLCTVTPA
jgi:acetyl-CoA/propionyl-CoA carboxylase biotin carboxyl carrier protein